MITIIITGTPGTGKTTISKKLAKSLSLYYVDVNNIIKKFKISEGIDLNRDTKIVDIRRLNKVMICEILKYKKLIYEKKSSKSNKKFNIGIAIDSHMSHYLPKRHVDLCIVMKCGLKVLEKRLKMKGFSKEKIRENMDAEIFDICLNEAKEGGHKILVIDSTKNINMKTLSGQIGGLIDSKKN